jgi:hypothetical protein
MKLLFVPVQVLVGAAPALAWPLLQTIVELPATVRGPQKQGLLGAYFKR